MLLTKANLYHPFKDSSLRICLKETLESDDLNGFVLEDIYLYHQPVLDPVIASICSLIMTILLFLGEYLHHKILIMLKKENSILNHITMVFVYAQMILWPLVIFLITTTNIVHPLNKLIGQWFCTLLRFFVYLLLNIVISHSLIAALMRYVFIVHTSTVEVYGKEKFKKLFLLLSISIPLFITILKVNDGAELDGLSFINKCNGKHHEVFLTETSTLNVFKKNFREFGGYYQHDVYGQLFAFLKNLSSIASMSAMLIVGSNLTEGIIYYRLFCHMNK